MLGYSQDEMLGKTPFDFVDDENRKVFIEQTSKISTTLHRSYEITLKKKKGQDLPTYFNATTIRNESGEVQGSFAFITDITEKKRMEVSLRQSESQKRAILDASIDRIRYIDKDMKIIWANKTTAMALNMSTEDLVGHTCYKLFVGRDTPCKVCPTVIARETGKIERAVMYQPKVKGIEGESYWDTYCVPLKNDAGEIESFIQIARNITDQKRAEEHINILTQELMRTQESERQRISRDLHDNVAQELSAVKIGCETLFDNQTNITPEIRKRMSQMSIMLQEIIKAIRDLSYYLRPSGLDEMGLIQTIFQYCHDFSEDNGINVDFHSAGMKDLTLDFDTEINLYRLIQEGLANIKKHADAEHVTIRLVAAFPNIILRIEDNGKGFDVQKRLATLSEEKRMGIRSMEQRAKLLQGEMEIQSKPMQGTKISIMLPYKDNKGDS
ncbi:MAG: PAS domain S-box protein [Deltaproteobacteria bacterium]|nr:PAS domain S-box protein [Deltaproteobacteria bacterium]